jgi:hypothetical protein
MARNEYVVSPCDLYLTPEMVKLSQQLAAKHPKVPCSAVILENPSREPIT